MDIDTRHFLSCKVCSKNRFHSKDIARSPILDVYFWHYELLSSHSSIVAQAFFRCFFLPPAPLIPPQWYLTGQLFCLDPTMKQAHINLGHFKTEQLKHNTYSAHPPKDSVNKNKKRKDDLMSTYERLCRGESRKVGN